MPDPSRAVRLFGTDEAVPPPRLLRAGALTAELEAGNLRYIRFGGAEMLRAVSFIVRDPNWATYNPEISGLAVEEGDGSFRVTYQAIARDASQAFRYIAEIVGEASGTLRFSAAGAADSPFTTNRTGFVVLHPIEKVAGAPVAIEHVDGRAVEDRFPALVDPKQPMMDLRALTHEFAPGARVTCRMEGDAFEMEDQRNWTDASYKTYVRPLALPWPYRLEPGAPISQSVTLTVSGQVPETAAPGPVALSVGAAAGAMPAIGLALDPDHPAATRQQAALIRQAGAAFLLCRFDPSHGSNRATLEEAWALADSLSAALWLELVVTAVEDYADEVAAVGALVRSLPPRELTVLVSPASDMKCTLPGSAWPPAAPLDGLYRAAREAFPEARLGGGMFSYFTELNRKRPPHELLDLVSFSTCPLVHMGDDRTVLENLESLPAVAASLRAMFGTTPYHVGPSAVGMRENPYGAAPMANPGNIRQAMSQADPRQRGLLAATWTLGHAARFAAVGASFLTLGAAAGPSGAVHVPLPHAQPFFDRSGGVFPVFHVIRGLAALRGRTIRHCDTSHPHDVLALAVGAPDVEEVWIANLTARDQAVALDAGWGGWRAAILDEDRFVTAAGDPALLDRLAPLESTLLPLPPLAVARLQAPRRRDDGKAANANRRSPIR